jgi:recombination directionality factor gp3-like protein
VSIIGLQRRNREVGRLRAGEQVTTRSGKRAPRKLGHWRLTSADRTVIEAAASIYGGTARPWDNDGSPEYEVLTTASELRIALPPNPADMGFSQFYEAWAKGFCTRRCDGERDAVRDVACDCDPDDRMCKATTRLTVFLPDIAGLGTWRLESHGWNAAVELGATIELIELLAGVRSIVPARLRLDQREKRKLINGKPEVFKFSVPVIDLDVSIQQVRQLAATNFEAMGSTGDLSLPAPPESGWKPIARTDAPLALTVEAQVAEHEKAKPAVKKRANAAAPLPPTGRPPRTAAQAAAEVCDICGQAYGADPLVANPNKAPGASRFVHRSHKAETEPAPPPEPEPVPEPEEPPPPRPAPTPLNKATMMPPKMRSKAMAMIAKLFPIDPETMSGAESDEYRRAITLDICAALGTPGLVTRGDIDKDTGMVLLDTLDAMEKGQVTFDLESRELLGADGQPIGF